MDFHVIIYYCSLSESPFRSSDLRLYSGCKKLRVTSPLLIVLADIDESHWVLATLPSIRGLWPHPSQWEWGMSESLTSNSGFRIFLFIPTRSGPFTVPPPLYGGYYLAIVSARLGMTLVPFKDASHNMVWCPDRFDHWGWKHQSCRTWWNVSYLHPSIRSYLEAGNLCESTNHLVHRLAGEFWCTLRGYAWVINVSAKH